MKTSRLLANLLVNFGVNCRDRKPAPISSNLDPAEAHGLLDAPLGMILRRREP